MRSPWPWAPLEETLNISLVCCVLMARSLKRKRAENAVVVPPRVLTRAEDTAASCAMLAKMAPFVTRWRANRTQLVAAARNAGPVKHITMRGMEMDFARLLRAIERADMPPLRLSSAEGQGARGAAPSTSLITDVLLAPPMPGAAAAWATTQVRDRGAKAATIKKALCALLRSVRRGCLSVRRVCRVRRRGPLASYSHLTSPHCLGIGIGIPRSPPSLPSLPPLTPLIAPRCLARSRLA